MERNALPRQFSSAKALRARNRVLFALFFIAAVSGPIAFYLAASAVTTAEQAAATVEGQTEALHRNFAEATAARWAFGGGEGFPTVAGIENYGRPTFTSSQAEELGINPAQAEDVTNLGVQQLIWQDFQLLELPNGRFGELHRFLIITESGMFWLTIPITESDPDPLTEEPQPALGGAPSITPHLISDLADEAVAIAWPDSIDRISTPENVQTRVAEWASAYAADATTDLYDVTGETEAVTYRGLGGFRVLEIDIGQTGEHPDHEDLFMTQVALTVANTRGVILQLDYDVLVDRIEDQRPLITGWGARGEGPHLEPWGQRASQGARNAGGFIPPAGLPSLPGSEDFEQDVTEFGQPVVNAEQLLGQLQSGDPNQIALALSDDQYDVGDAARLAEAIQEASSAVLQHDSDIIYPQDSQAELDVDITVDGETGTARYVLRWDEQQQRWAITQFNQREAPEHPLSQGVPR